MIRAPIQRWLQSRLPVTDTWPLTQRNLYILPTKAGLSFAGTLLLMLVASINYQLNLGYALTFLLAGAALVSMHITHGNLRGLTLHLRPAQPVFVGEPALLDVVLQNPGHERAALGLRFESEDAGGLAWCDAPAGGQASVQLSLVPARRGWQPVPALVVETLFPFGLFRAWTVWRPAARVLAWPKPEHPAPPLPLSSARHGEEHSSPRGSGGELDGVRLLSPATVAAASTVQSHGLDLVLVVPMDWRLGYHRVFTTRGTVGPAFGHFGFGGSGGWADPSRDLSVAYVCNRGSGTPIGDLRIAELGAAAVRCVDRRRRARVNTPGGSRIGP